MTLYILYKLNLWLDPWLGNIYKNEICGQICDVVGHIEITFVVTFVIS
jgi:hypothetical protein